MMKPEKMKCLSEVENGYKSLKMPLVTFLSHFWKICKMGLTWNANISGTT